MLGQNVNSYRGAAGTKDDFVKLLEQINKIDGLERIRFLTSHPKDMSENLSLAIRDLEKVCEQVHFPIQAGSNSVLGRMNRKYTCEQYLHTVNLLRERVPGIAISTDIIVGFPGETDSEFEETVRLMRKVEFDGAFIFRYSTRKGTPAAKMEAQVPDDVKRQRNQVLLKLQEEVTLKKNMQIVGSDLDVLVEGKSKRNPNRYTGRSRCNRIVVFPGEPSDVGKIVNVHIKRATSLTLFAEKIE